MSYQQAMNAYNQNQNETRFSVASPYRLVQMTFEKLQDHMARARGAMERNDYSEKGLQISRCLELLGALRGALDLEVGGDVAENLSNLYLFCSQTLMQASRDNSTEQLEHAVSVIREIKTAWDQLEQNGAPA